MLLIAILLLGLLCASGFIYVNPRSTALSGWRHGWPWTFLTREAAWITPPAANWSGPTPPPSPPLHTLDPASIWAFTQKVTSFQWPALVADILMVVALAVFVALAFEWRRRRQMRFFSFSLKEFFVMALLVAVALGYVHELRVKQRETLAFASQFGSRAQIGVDHGLPGWLWVLLPADAYRLGDRISRAYLFRLENPESDLRQLASLRDLRSFTYTGLNMARIDDHANHLGKLTALVKLDLAHSDLTDLGLAHLAGLKKLETLRLPRSFSDAGLVHLAQLKRLEELSLSCDHITDNGLAHLAGLQNLQTLFLGGATQITDLGAAQLASISRLESLTLDSARITDSALLHLSRLTSLKSLMLPGANLTDAGLEHLRILHRLDFIQVGGAGITDRGLEMLSQHTTLTAIELDGSKVTDAGREHLRSLTGLHTLILRGAEITDRGLETLAGLPSLKTLLVNGRMMTADGVAKLKSARTDMEIIQEGITIPSPVVVPDK